MNNIKSSAIEKTPNEVCYGFSINSGLNGIDLDQTPDPLRYRSEAADAIAYTQMVNKQHYDRRHHPQFFRVGDWVRIRLHRGYTTPNIKDLGKKFGPQTKGPYKILERIGRLAYRLDINPQVTKIHPVISVAHLEGVPNPTLDPYERPVPEEPGSVEVEEDIKPHWEIERIVNKRVINTTRGEKTQYLLHWKGFGTKDDMWIDAKGMNADELIKEYNANKYLESTNETKEPRRGRGRPRKVMTNETPKPETRPRGRPRKNRQDSEHQADALYLSSASAAQGPHNPASGASRLRRQQMTSHVVD